MSNLADTKPFRDQRAELAKTYSALTSGRATPDYLLRVKLSMLLIDTAEMILDTSVPLVHVYHHVMAAKDYLNQIVEVIGARLRKPQFTTQIKNEFSEVDKLGYYEWANRNG